MKATLGDIRAIARQTVDGRAVFSRAKNAYLKALAATAQAELEKAADPEAQRRCVNAVHKRFKAVVIETIATDEILAAAGFPRKEIARERNRRTNFVRTAHGALRRWLRVQGHDLAKLDAGRLTKKQLEEEAPSPKPQAYNSKRARARVEISAARFLTNTRRLVQNEPQFANAVIGSAMRHLVEQLESAAGADPRMLAAAAKFLRQVPAVALRLVPKPKAA